MDFDIWKGRWYNSLLLVTILDETSTKRMYGGEIIKMAKNRISNDIKVPTIYAILKRATDDGLLELKVIDEKAKITRGTKRKYYKLTKKGLNYLNDVCEILINSKVLIENILEVRK